MAPIPAPPALQEPLTMEVKPAPIAQWLNIAQLEPFYAATLRTPPAPAARQATSMSSAMEPAA